MRAQDPDWSWYSGPRSDTVPVKRAKATGMAVAEASLDIVTGVAAGGSDGGEANLAEQPATMRQTTVPAASQRITPTAGRMR